MRRSAAVLALALSGLIRAGAASPDSGQALRKATNKERANILKGWNAKGYESGRCKTAGFILRVSTVNSHYARLSYHHRQRARAGCGAGDGFAVMRNRRGKWRDVGQSSWTGAPCWAAPRRVALDLVSDVARRDSVFRGCDRG